MQPARGADQGDDVAAVQVVAIAHRLFEPDNRVRPGFRTSFGDLLEIGPRGIIRPPIEGQYYDAWLDAMHQYRETALRLDQNGSPTGGKVYTIDFGGSHGAWLRLNAQLARSLQLALREELTWRIDVRVEKEANGTFYLAFDIHDHEGRTIG